MNKRSILVIAMMAVLSMSGVKAMATPSHLGLLVTIIDPDKGTDVKRSPIRVPSVSIEDYFVYFNTSCDGCTLRLLDEDGEVAYAIVIPEGTASLTLPSYLEGDYEIQIIRGNFCFYGYISF